jgi:hypothetical protein
LTWAFAQYLPPAEKIILLALADYADDTGRCWPSQETLTAKTSLSIRTIRTHLHALADAGFIAVETRHRDDGGRRSNAYVLQMQAATPRQILPDPPANIDRTPRQTVAGIEEPSIEPPDEPSLRQQRAGRATEKQVEFIRDLYTARGGWITAEREAEWLALSIAEADALIQEYRAEPPWRRKQAGGF